MTVLDTLHKQWAARPADERFLDLESLYQAQALLRDNASQPVWRFNKYAPEPFARLSANEETGALYMEKNGTKFYPTHFSFGQLATKAKAPAGYLRTLPAPLAAANLMFGLTNPNNPRATESSKLYLVPAVDRETMTFAPDSDGKAFGRILAITGPDYGRVWNADVVQAVMGMRDQATSKGISWTVPAASYQSQNPKLATTLYGGEGDVYIFLVDAGRSIDVGGRNINRMFMISNSERGDATLKIMTGAYDNICDNRYIWGATDVETRSIRHTKYAPERFVREVAPYLVTYALSNSAKIEAQVKIAQETRVSLADDSIVRDRAGVVQFYLERGYPEAVAKASAALAEQEARPDTAWGVFMGLTAYARGIDYQDERLDFETKAGKLFESLVKV